MLEYLKAIYELEIANNKFLVENNKFLVEINKKVDEIKAALVSDFVAPSSASPTADESLENKN